MSIGLDVNELETMIKKGVPPIVDSRLSQTYEKLVKNIAASTDANNERLLSQIRAAGVPFSTPARGALYLASLQARFTSLWSGVLYTPKRGRS